MEVIIIEDEVLAAERLQILLKDYDPDVRIVACLENIEETIQWLQTKKHPDLIFLDIHLSDGHSFEIFKKVTVFTPIVFTTAYDAYALDAFRLHSIDYILKPVTADALAAAIQKFNRMAKMTPFNYSLLGDAGKTYVKAPFRERFLAKVGQRSFFVTATDVAYFVSDNKILYLVDREGNRALINFTLEKLEPLLDPREFFRINRSIIVHSTAIAQIKPYFNNRLKLILKNINPEEEIVVSRERVREFKDWAES